MRMHEPSQSYKSLTLVLDNLHARVHSGTHHLRFVGDFGRLSSTTRSPELVSVA